MHYENCEQEQRESGGGASDYGWRMDDHEGGMNMKQHKAWVGTGIGILLVLLVFLLKPSPSPPSAVRLTFLYTTNNPEAGKVVVFEFVNQLNESVNSWGGHYKPAKRHGFDAQRGDRGAVILGVHQFAAGTTNILQFLSPTNGGPYKLVLRYIPVSKTTLQFTRSARFSIGNLVTRWVRLPFVTSARWFGTVFLESQSFEATP